MIGPNSSVSIHAPSVLFPQAPSTLFQHPGSAEASPAQAATALGPLGRRVRKRAFVISAAQSSRFSSELKARTRASTGGEAWGNALEVKQVGRWEATVGGKNPFWTERLRWMKLVIQGPGRFASTWLGGSQRCVLKSVNTVSKTWNDCQGSLEQSPFLRVLILCLDPRFQGRLRGGSLRVRTLGRKALAAHQLKSWMPLKCH